MVYYLTCNWQVWVMVAPVAQVWPPSPHTVLTLSDRDQHLKSVY